MADLSLTPANILAVSTATTEHGVAGATVTAGQVVALNTTTGKYVLADADGAAGIDRPRGIALNGASDGQPLAIAKAGPVTLGAVLTVGVSYFLSPTPGGIAPRADVLTADIVTHLGIATTTSSLLVDLQYSGVASA